MTFRSNMRGLISGGTFGLLVGLYGQGIGVSWVLLLPPALLGLVLGAWIALGALRNGNL